MFLKKNKLGKIFLCVILTLLLGMGSLIAVIPQPATAATTSLTITKLASDGTTVLKQRTVDYTWLMENMEIMGDGVTRYYHQGPVFIDDPDPKKQEELRWNEEEDTNWDTKDMGAVRGTNAKDLCELVGGMKEGDKLKFKAVDGWSRTFAYKNVYEYSDREGPIVVCWEKDGEYPDSGYSDGMRMVWFAEATEKADGPKGSGLYHVFGNYDWKLAAADPSDWYYYAGEYPTTTGLSGQMISELIIYSNEPVPATYTAIFEVTPVDADIVVKDSEGKVVEPEQDGTYKLVAGEYSYTVSKEGYVTKSGTFTIVESDETITVELEEETIDILYDGTVTLTKGETFDVIASNKVYTVNKTTPLGALHAAATANKFSYVLSDKRWSEDEVLLLDDVGDYKYGDPGKWYAYVNGIYKDGYINTSDGLNVVELVDGDKVEFYYAADITDATDVNAVKAAAIAAVKTQVIISSTPTDPTDWNLQLIGARDEIVDKEYFERGISCASSSHHVTWTDDDDNIWGGVPLWLLVGMVDDNPDMGPYHINFNDELAAEGYKVKVISGDGYSAELDSTDIARNNNYIVANTLNGEPLPLKTDSDKDCWPLHLKGSGPTGKQQVGNIVRIELLNLPEPDLTIPELRIVKYGEDHTTIVEELTITYEWMEENLDVIGDGTTVYKFQGVTFDPEDIWDENEVGLGGYKIENAVKGTRISDLCDLVGGMGAGTDIVLVAKDGWQTKLPYSSIYPDPSVQARQGDAIIAWWADGEYVPDYKDGMRLFFTPDDQVYSQMDMRETLPEDYWHYYGADGVMYPSCAGLSAKYITELRIYTVPQGDWALELDGQDIGGLYSNVSKTYFESALTCTMGANHKTIYTDSKNRVWEGMPLWLLVGFVDDADQHSNNAFSRELAMTGYQVVITAADGHSVVIDSKDIDRNNDYIIANSLNEALIPETDKAWPLRLVGPKVSGSDSIGNIISIKLLSSAPVEPDKPHYNVLPAEDTAYTIEATPDGINTMTVNAGNNGLKYFTVNITPVKSHDGKETVVFTHLRNGVQLQLNAVVADFDEVETAQAGFNVQPGDVIKVYIVDQLTNDVGQNPILFQ